MRILVLAATRMELLPFLEKSPFFSEEKEWIFREIGVGCLSATFQTAKYIQETKPDFVVLGGIAGAFDPNFSIGDVYLITSDMQATTGVEENGIWKDVMDMGFSDKNQFPYANGRLVNDTQRFNSLSIPSATAISVDEITTNPARIKCYQQKYRAQIESMEGAAFQYTCLQLAVPFVQIRSISNYVGDRNKANWNFGKAIAQLNQSLEKIIAIL